MRRRERPQLVVDERGEVGCGSLVTGGRVIEQAGVFIGILFRLYTRSDRSQLENARPLAAI
jgi:hypothetical protein